MTPNLARCVGRIVGARLRELRLEAELSQMQIANHTGISREVISRIERGEHVASLETIVRYASALDVEVSTVLVCLDVDWIEAGHAAQLTFQKAGHA